MAELRESAPARGRAAGRAVTPALVLAALLAGLALAPSANAGQIVWSANNGIWAMKDDGSHPHQLISAVAPQLAASLASGTVSAPDIFQNGGTTVLFLGSTNAFATSSQPQACGADCSDSYALSNGTLTALGPPPAAAAGMAYYETRPRLAADAQEMFSFASYTGIVGSSLGAPAHALAERQAVAGAPATSWSDTARETAPVSGFDGAPNPAQANQAAWVEQQQCTLTLNGQNACQYAIHVGSPSDANPPVAEYDREYSSAAAGYGRGPTSLAWSSDGANLLMVDPFAPNTGIYEFAAAGQAGAKAVTEVIVQPPGWTFGQARFAGSKIVFDAHQQVAGTTTGDIFTIAANCAKDTCAFPANATNLTNDPPANSADPAWTSATETLAPLHTAGGPRVTTVTLPSRTIRAGRRFTLLVALSAPGTVVVKIARLTSGARKSPAARPPAAKTRPVGSVTFACKAGSNRLSIGLVAGKSLAAGAYAATVGVKGSKDGVKTVHFSVHR